MQAPEIGPKRYQKRYQGLTGLWLLSKGRTTTLALPLLSTRPTALTPALPALGGFHPTPSRPLLLLPWPFSSKNLRLGFNARVIAGDNSCSQTRQLLLSQVIIRVLKLDNDVIKLGNRFGWAP